MKIAEFKEWLQMMYPESNTTVNNRLSNCKNIEKYYGNLDYNFDTDKCQKIISELTYSINDERNEIKQLHNIPIDGNIRTGSATLKQAIKLYVEFRLFLLDDNLVNSKISPSIINRETSIRDQLIQFLAAFNFNSNRHKDTTILQIELQEFLSNKLPYYNWEIEYKPSQLCKDSVDVFGSSLENSLKIVIEIDAFRADQVAKKFVSRSSLFINEDVLYISLCYPETERMSKKECTKYFQYCNDLCDFITKNTKYNKQYIGHYL
jgi:hypothetical protein